MTAPLLVIVPSRGRPQAIAALIDAWEATADGGLAELLVCVDGDDETLGKYPASNGWLWYSYADRNGFAPRLTEEAVFAARGAIYTEPYPMLASWGDDHVPRSKGWDTAIVDALTDLGTGFAYGDDCIQGQALPTACAMTSDIVRALGWMTPPGFRHLYVDNVWKDLGEGIDRITYLPEVVIEHVHPIAGKAEWDGLYVQANTGPEAAADEAAYHDWRQRQMPADIETLRGLL